MSEEGKVVLDACCGAKMFWFDRKNPLATFMDKRFEKHLLCNGYVLEVAPDLVADFKRMPFADETFYLVVFDPPHLTSLKNDKSWLAQKYGRLLPTWRDEIQEGFAECFRVLKPFGTLIFKWNTTDISTAEVLKLTDRSPLFGHTGHQSETIWMTFLKTPS